jgi:HAD superfamily hydrolase (TIGR01549 family)
VSGKETKTTATTVILDVDGTLVDTNYHHTLAWYRALRAHGYIVQMWRVHRHIGMGGDQIVGALIGEEAAGRDGDAIRSNEAEGYKALIEEVEPMAGAREILRDFCQDEGLSVVLASSARKEEVDHYLDLLGARELVDAWTTAADVERTKPFPDLVHAALEKSDGDGPTLMIGDSVWDVKAANAAELPTLAVLTGGFSEAELREAGAVAVVEGLDRITQPRSLVASLAAA